jgi:hypothetical protein
LRLQSTVLAQGSQQSKPQATQLRDLTEAAESGSGAFLLLQALDPVVIGLKLLYRSRRISAELYLQILGGFVRPVSMH